MLLRVLVLAGGVGGLGVGVGGLGEGVITLALARVLAILASRDTDCPRGGRCGGGGGGGGVVVVEEGMEVLAVDTFSKQKKSTYSDLKEDIIGRRLFRENENKLLVAEEEGVEEELEVGKWV